MKVNVTGPVVLIALIAIIVTILLIGCAKSGAVAPADSSPDAPTTGAPAGAAPGVLPGTAQSMRNISPREAFRLVQDNRSNPDFIILDVRTPEEFAGGYLEGAAILDYYSANFRSELGNLDKKKVYLVYCRSGNRSGNTLKIMQELGFTEAYNMTGGITRWQKEGLPVVRKES